MGACESERQASASRASRYIRASAQLEGMLDSSRRDVLTSAAITSARDFASGAAAAVVVRLTGVEALESDDDEREA
jgi:hypothetical protein